MCTRVFHSTLAAAWWWTSGWKMDENPLVSKLMFFKNKGKTKSHMRVTTQEKQANKETERTPIVPQVWMSQQLVFPCTFPTKGQRPSWRGWWRTTGSKERNSTNFRFDALAILGNILKEVSKEKGWKLHHIWFPFAKFYSLQFSLSYTNLKYLIYWYFEFNKGKSLFD